MDDSSPIFSNMRKDSPLYKALSKSGQEQANKAARALQGFLDNESKVPSKVAGCRNCKERLANPHADYVIPPVIDTSKI